MFRKDPENPEGGGNEDEEVWDGNEYMLTEVEKMFILAAERGDIPSVKK